jgi:hypothetical protein
LSRILHIESLPSASEESWIDADKVLVHALFQILIDFVENERPYEIGLTARLAWHGLPIPEEERSYDYPGLDLDKDVEEWRKIYAQYHWWKQHANSLREELEREADTGGTSLYDELTARLEVLIALRRHYWT